MAVLGGARDYGSRLSRARWRRALGAEGISQIDPVEAAAAAFARAPWWVVLIEEGAISIDVSGARPPAGCVLGAAAVEPGAVVHTLRELEQRFGNAVESHGAPPPAVSFATPDWPARPGESAGDYVSRLREACRPQDRRPGFTAFCAADASENARPELAGLVAASARRLLDVGCGSGGFSASLKRARPDLFVVGIERNAEAAGRARARLDRVLACDALAALRRLAAEGERFDTVVFADVLEHLEDPVSALREARSVAAPNAALIASLPNVGHSSLVRDLLRGRFDPVSTGLLDAEHVRWFDRTLSAETVAEAGWRLEALRALPGAAAPDAGEFLDWAAAFPGADRESLATYQWIVVAAAPGAGGVPAGAAAR